MRLLEICCNNKKNNKKNDNNISYYPLTSRCTDGGKKTLLMKYSKDFFKSMLLCIHVWIRTVSLKTLGKEKWKKEKKKKMKMKKKKKKQILFETWLKLLTTTTCLCIK